MSYNLYLAKVVNIAAQDNRLQVKILPHMTDFADVQCPIWSCFFKDELIVANKGELVWVICDDEFSNGYILGTANYTTFRDAPFNKGSIPKDFKEIIDNALVDLKAKKFDFVDLKVDFWNSSSIHFIERSTGGRVIAFRNGSLYVIRSNELLIKLGSSLISINEDGITMKGNSIGLQSEDVALGNNPIRNVLTTFGARSNVSEPSEYVRA